VEPISSAIDQVEKVIGHSIHPAIVALPLGAWTVSNICDGMALISGEEKYDDAARISMGIGLIGAAGAVVTGLNDYAKIPKNRPSHRVATTHALGNSLVGSLFVASYVMRTRAHTKGEPTSLAARLLAIAGGGLSIYTAWLGGKLVQEMGESVKPVMEELSQEEKSEKRHTDGRKRLEPTALGRVSHV
jgi:uncharacterized membrane protein